MTIKKLLLFLCLLPSMAWAYSRTIEYHGLNYTLFDDGSAKVVPGATKYSGSVVIRSSVEYEDVTYKVTGIGESAFLGCKELSSVYIPNTVSYISASAFAGCSNLASVNIPNSVVFIDSDAFAGCTSLTEVDIPNSVTNMGAYVFYKCSNLASVTIGSGLEQLGGMAFEDCTSLTSIVIPNTMKTIGALAFYHCTALSSVTIPNSVTKINSFAFDSCVSLKSIVIPNSVTDMGDYTFMDCKKLTSISLSNGLTKIGTDNFRGCTSLASLAIPESVTSIGARAFQESGITSITLPNSVSAIGRDAFLDCVNLSSVCFGKGVSSSSFDYSAFDGCSNITSVEYHCKEIGDWFIGGESIKEVVIGDEVTSIGSSAFSGCTGLTSVTIPNSVTSIGVSAFRGCSGLTSITIPESVASIGSYAFENCTGLTSVTIGNGVTSIGEYAFVWCTSLKTIIIPHSVTSIGGGAFDRCTNIKDLHCYASNVPSTSSIFLGLSMELATLHVPAVALADYRNAWPWSSFGTIKAIGYEVTIPAEGVCTYSNAYDIDFTGVTGLMAYVASGFSPSTGELTLTRVYEVPAGEGLVLKGNVGKYEVPYATTDKVYSNLLKGVTKVTTVAPTDGDYTNFILANGSHGTGFYTLANTGELAAGKSYLQLLTTDISALAREGVSLMFSDETLGLDILTISSFDNSIYDLQGRRVENPMHGLYIVNGKKVIIK